MTEVTNTINEILSKMKVRIEKIIPLHREIVFENVEIYHETDRAILIELEDQSIWLPKADIKIEKKKESATITIPCWLMKKRFSPQRYKQFLKMQPGR